MKKVKIGIVGCGLVTKNRHIPSYLKLRKNVELSAVCDLSETLARETAREFHVPNAYTDVSEMVSKQNLDIVDICVPPQIHAPIAIEAMENGCNVLTEKPMALKVSDCDGMIEASQRNGVKLCIVHNDLFHPPFLKAKELMAKGAIGDFIGMRCFHSDFRDEMVLMKDHWIHKLPGGLLGETAPHPVYMSLAFIGKVKNVGIYAKNFLEHPWAPFDEFRIELEGEKAISSIAISYASNRYNTYIDLLGTEGVLHLDLQSFLLVRHGGKESVKPTTLARYSLSTAFQIIKGVTKNSLKIMTGMGKLGTDVVVERFVGSVLNDTLPPVTAEEGRETVRVMEWIVKEYKDKYGG